MPRAPLLGNDDDRRQWRMKGGVVGAAASKTRAQYFVRSGCWEPQPVAVCASRLGEFFEPILFFLCQKEKNGFNLPRKERGPVPTVVLNLTQMISDSSCPSRKSLPPDRSLRSAHCLSAELHSRTKAFGPMKASAPTRERERCAKKQNRDPAKRSRF